MGVIFDTILICITLFFLLVRKMMIILIFYVSIICLSFNCAVSAIPKPDEKQRIVDDLSHVKHFQDDTHNPQYDHDAFLGEDQAKTFDQLAPEESRRRLG